MSQVDALTRISQIQAQLAALTGGSPSAATGTAAGAAGAALPGAADVNGVLATTAPGASDRPSFANALAQAQSLAPAAAHSLTSGQQQFASQLAAKTGLNSSVIAAWLLAEESGGAATSRERANNHNWLNIGYTDSGTYGASDSIWSNPITAADATAGWLKGQDTIPGYGRAASGIQAIMQTAGQSPQAQMAAIENSGWASGGYPELAQLFAQVGG